MNSKFILNSANVLVLMFFLNFFGWLFFFPDEGTVDTSNPKMAIGMEVLTYFVYIVLFFFVSVVIPKPKLANAVSLKLNCNLNEQYWYKVGVLSVFISLFSVFVKYQEFLSSLSNFSLFLERGGSHVVANEMVLGGGGLSPFQSLWIVGAIIFSRFVFVNRENKFSYINLFFALCFLVSLLSSIVESTRTSLMIFILITLFSYLASDIYRRVVLIALFSVFAGFALYWIGSYFRDAQYYMDELNSDFLTVEVQWKIISVFLEKYSVGEFNNTLIIFGQDFLKMNPFYFTLISSYFPVIKPNGYLNTLHTFGIWYWQFGYFVSFVFVAIFSCFLKVFYYYFLREIKVGVFGFFSIFYCLLWVGVVNSTRINFFMLGWFVFPAVYILFFQALKKIFLK